MDQTPGSGSGNSVVVTGCGWEASPAVWALITGKADRIAESQLVHDGNPRPFLRVRKTVKFMGKQDRLAVCAGGKALLQAGLGAEILTERCGVFMAVGYIPFSKDTAEAFCRLSQEGGRFSMKRFSTEAFDAVNPLLTFSCLPNMPAHHLSANFDLQGEYFVTYPGAPQLYHAMSEALASLGEGRSDVVLLGGVADQTNFLVRNHFRKRQPEAPPMAADAAAFVVLEQRSHAENRGRTPLCRLRRMNILPVPEGSGGALSQETPVHLGPADLPLKLSAYLQAHGGDFEHRYTDDTGVFSSSWGPL